MKIAPNRRWLLRARQLLAIISRGRGSCQAFVSVLKPFVDHGTHVWKTLDNFCTLRTPKYISAICGQAVRKGILRRHIK